MSNNPLGKYPCGHASTTSDYCSVCGAQSEFAASRSTEAGLVAEAADLRRQRDEWKALASRYPARLEEAERLLGRIDMAYTIGRGVESTMKDIREYVEAHDVEKEGERGG